MSSKSVARRSRTRRTAEGAFGLLLLLRSGVMALLTALLLTAGVWTSWDTVRPAMLTQAGERSTMLITACGEDTCRGRVGPGGDGSVKDGLLISSMAAGAPKPGARLEVAWAPGWERPVRRGLAGTLYAWLPFAGALLLAAPVVAGGLRLTRTGGLLAVLGAGTMVAAYAAL